MPGLSVGRWGGLRRVKEWCEEGQRRCSGVDVNVWLDASCVVSVQAEESFGVLVDDVALLRGMLELVDRAKGGPIREFGRLSLDGQQAWKSGCKKDAAYDGHGRNDLEQIRCQASEQAAESLAGHRLATDVQDARVRGRMDGGPLSLKTGPEQVQRVDDRCAQGAADGPDAGRRETAERGIVLVAASAAGFAPREGAFEVLERAEVDGGVREHADQAHRQTLVEGPNAAGREHLHGRVGDQTIAPEAALDRLALHTAGVGRVSTSERMDVRKRAPTTSAYRWDTQRPWKAKVSDERSAPPHSARYSLGDEACDPTGQELGHRPEPFRVGIAFESGKGPFGRLRRSVAATHISGIRPGRNSPRTTRT